MANNYKDKEAKEKQESAEKEEQLPEDLEKKLPKEVKEKLKKIKEKLDEFNKQVLKKFDKYIMGIALLPPQKPSEGEQVEIDKNKINVLVLVDDSDSQKMSKVELKQKLDAIINKIAEDIDKNIAPQTIILSELWQSCYDGKYEILQTIAVSAPIYDTGMLAAIKIAEVHKTMVLKKFEKYIVSYVLAGSLVQGRATKESDIDVFVVIDDTDVKRMTRAELKDKLRAIIIGMGIEAGELTGIKNKLNIQVYILTDFWDSIKEANPIIFTFLRDGVPFYDRGIFMPWKQLLKMGKIKPSMEAIEMYMSSGEQMLQRVSFKMKDIAMEDIYYALLTPSQAAIMLYGLPPPTPKETPDIMREVFVRKEKLLEENFVQILEKVIKIRKDVEHGTKKDVTGKEIDELLEDSEKYLKRIKKLFTQIEKMKEEENMVSIYDTITTIVRDILRMEGIEKAKSQEILELFETEMVHKGKIPDKFLRILHLIEKAKADYDAGKLTKSEVENVKKHASQLIKFLVEYMQRKRGREIERAKIRVKHGNRYGEVILLENEAFIIHDIDKEEKEISKAKLNPDGSLGTITESSLEEFENALAKVEIPPKVFIKEKVFEDLKRIFGKDVEVLVNY
ncbi:MAG: nucleotidyltransferase domain-containing protein [Candidatus Woesearchaeota archaeon]|nr:nucleotidyltransferase domain-containing protein [Candidatus Woesearchaeota archaeon]